MLSDDTGRLRERLRRQGACVSQIVSAALAEASLAAALVRAGTTAGVACGRPITDPPGYKRIQRLQQVRAAVEEAAQKRGLRKTAGR